MHRLDDSLLPRRLWPAGRGDAEKEGPVTLFLSPPLTVAGVEAWLEGLLLQLALAVLAGDLKNALLHCRLRLSCVVLPTVPDPQKTKQVWKEVALHLPLSARPAGLTGERHR